MDWSTPVINEIGTQLNMSTHLTTSTHNNVINNTWTQFIFKTLSHFVVDPINAVNTILSKTKITNTVITTFSEHPAQTVCTCAWVLVLLWSFIWLYRRLTTGVSPLKKLLLSPVLLAGFYLIASLAALWVFVNVDSLILDRSPSLQGTLEVSYKTLVAIEPAKEILGQQAVVVCESDLLMEEGYSNEPEELLKIWENPETNITKALCDRYRNRERLDSPKFWQVGRSDVGLNTSQREDLLIIDEGVAKTFRDTEDWFHKLVAPPSYRAYRLMMKIDSLPPPTIFDNAFNSQSQQSCF